MKCSNCVATPNFGTRFTTMAGTPGVCSGQCDFCFACYVRTKYTQRGIPRCFELDPTCPLAPKTPEISFFEQVVGIHLDEWMAAKTPEQLAELIARRDAG